MQAIYDFGGFGTAGAETLATGNVGALSGSGSSGGFLDYLRGGLSVLNDATLLGLNAYGTFQQVRGGLATGASQRGPEYAYDPIPARVTDGSPQALEFERQAAERRSNLLIFGVIAAAVVAVLVLRK